MMSRWARLALPARPPAPARAYSSFFSSKPGGGKSPKPAVLQPARSEPTEPTATSPASVADDSVPDPQSPPHPILSSKEYRLHQFFSLHRPLLLLGQPTSAIFDPNESQSTWNPLPTIDNPPESSPEADADAARQLAHALVMNRVGGAIAWQHAVSRLGLGPKHAVDDIALARESAQEWVTIHADSTRRKKRKKMKKHKLKKRRRLTRRQNK